MKMSKILFATALAVLFAQGSAYSQDVVVPADSDDIKAFEKALMKQYTELKDKKNDPLADAQGEEIDESISKEIKEIQNLDDKSRNKIKRKVQEKAHADAQDMGPKGTQNPADVVSEPAKGEAAANPP